MKRSIIIAILSLNCAVFAIAQKAKHASGKNNPSAVFDAYIQKALAVWKTPGLAVAVVKDGKVAFMHSYGVKKYGEANPVNDTTLFENASTSKAMTTMCLALLVDDGKLHWSDRVVDVLPDFQLYDPYVTQQLTITDLVTHCTGYSKADLIAAKTSDDWIERMKFLPPDYSLRSTFIYQNAPYVIAAKVIAQVSGTTTEEFFRQRLFVPIGMKHAYPTYAYSKNETDRVTPHYLMNDTVKPITFYPDDYYLGASAPQSSITDMTKWMMFLLDSAKVNGKKLLSAGQYREIFTPHHVIQPDEFYPTMKFTKPHWMTYGYAWFQHDYRGEMVQFHTGSEFGDVAIIGLIPDLKFGVFVFGNMDHSEIRHALMYKAIDLWCFNDNSRDWSNDLFGMYTSMEQEDAKQEAEEKSKRQLNTHPSLDLKNYCGEFSDPAFGNISVSLSNGQLHLTVHGDYDYDLTLEHWQYDTFVGHWQRWWIEDTRIFFSLDGKGQVSQLSFGGIVFKRDASAGRG